MNPFDGRPTPPKDAASEPEQSPAQEASGETLQPLEITAQDLAAVDQLPQPVRAYPEDLEISWSWAHFVVFVVFVVVSFVLVNTVTLIAYAPRQRMSREQLQQYFMSKPEVAIGSMLLLYACIIFFLYVTLSLLRGHPFWQTLGWRKLKPKFDGLPRNPLVYFVSGCGLSLLVALATAKMKTPENMPMEELFKYRQTALLFLAMAVLVAPLVEETLFRGYMYPLFARSFGVRPGIAVTGVLFGLMHGAQLGWTWALVSVLIFVGIVFTMVRARTGSVFASYLMHLGYNSLISIFAILGTHGFTKLPDH